jgi:hypothetical protein
LGTTGGGLDRIDSKKGYTKDNCVPCCGFCNNLKAWYLTPSETKKVVDLLKELRQTEDIWKLAPKGGRRSKNGISEY